MEVYKKENCIWTVSLKFQTIDSMGQLWKYLIVVSENIHRFIILLAFLWNIGNFPRYYSTFIVKLWKIDKHFDKFSLASRVFQILEKKWTEAPATLVNSIFSFISVYLHKLKLRKAYDPGKSSTIPSRCQARNTLDEVWPTRSYFKKKYCFLSTDRRRMRMTY